MLLHHMTVLLVIFWRTATPFLKVNTPFYILTNSGQSFQFLRIVSKNHYFPVCLFLLMAAIPMGTRWCLCGLTGISLTINDIENLSWARWPFKCLLW